PYSILRRDVECIKETLYNKFTKEKIKTNGLNYIYILDKDMYNDVVQEINNCVSRRALLCTLDTRLESAVEVYKKYGTNPKKSPLIRNKYAFSAVIQTDEDKDVVEWLNENCEHDFFIHNMWSYPPKKTRNVMFLSRRDFVSFNLMWGDSIINKRIVEQ